MNRTAEMNEAERLAAVRRLELLDTAPEPEFDELVELAAALCEAPMSLLTLLDEQRQWIKAAFGVELREIAREVAIRQDGDVESALLIMEDLAKEPHLAANPLVSGEARARFYAGVPICNAEGQELGTLCVLDKVPRQLTASQMAALRVMGRHAKARMEARTDRRAMERAQAAAEQVWETELRRYQEDLETANARLRELATTDPLTGLANRRVFDERLTAEFLAARRHKRALSVLMLDVDNFKERNDRFGHDEGDATLRRLSVLMAQSIRGSDLLVRYGGEEFILLLPETDEARGVQLAERILAAVRSEEWPHGMPVTMSGGVAQLEAATPNQQRLVTLADEALYAAKHAGKNSVVGYGTYYRTVVAAMEKAAE